VIELPAHAPPLFPYTTLFRSRLGAAVSAARRAVAVEHLPQLAFTDPQDTGEEAGLGGRRAVLPQEPSAGRPRGDVQLLGHVLGRSEEHTSELQSRENLVCRLL